MRGGSGRDLAVKPVLRFCSYFFFGFFFWWFEEKKRKEERRKLGIKCVRGTHSVKSAGTDDAATDGRTRPASSRPKASVPSQSLKRSKKTR